MQKEIISKERRIFELEKKFSLSKDEVGRLKLERDRLVEISNNLRAELIKTKSKLNHAVLNSSSAQANMIVRESKSMFSFNEIKEDSQENVQSGRS